jgi:hypothetical protein
VNIFKVASPSSPFENPKGHGWILGGQRGEHGQLAVKVIDPRGIELLVVKKLEETK